MTELISTAAFPTLLWVCTAISAGLALASSVAGFALERALQPTRRIFALPLARGQLARESLASARFALLCGIALASLLASGALRFGEPSAIRAALTFGGCWLLFEIYYYGLHRLLHWRPLYRFHAHHHESHVTTPVTGFSLGTVEALGWIFGLALAPLALSLVAPISPAGFALYVVYNFFGNVVGHINAELGPAWFARRPFSWWIHPYVYHSLHHARFRNHYGFGSTFMDRLFGTEWEDWPRLHARVLAGQPLSRMAERG